MKECKHCNVKVNTNLDYCPLCFEKLEGTDKCSPPYQLKDKNECEVKNEYMLVKIFTFLSICAISICAFINILTKSVAWSLLVAVCIMYLWILVRHTILSKRNTFEKIFLQILFVTLIVLCSNKISGGGDWFLNYVLPSILLTVVFVLSMILLISKKRNVHLFSFFLIFIVLTILSTILVVFKLDTFRLLNLINIIVCSLLIVGNLIFGFKYIKQEFAKKFHL